MAGGVASWSLVQAWGMELCAVDALISLNHIVRKSDWKSPVGAGPLAMPEALRISGKHLQSPALRFARRTPAELLGHDVIPRFGCAGRITLMPTERATKSVICKPVEFDALGIITSSNGSR